MLGLERVCRLPQRDEHVRDQLLQIFARGEAAQLIADDGGHIAAVLPDGSFQCSGVFAFHAPQNGFVVRTDFLLSDVPSRRLTYIVAQNVEVLQDYLKIFQNKFPGMSPTAKRPPLGEGF